MSSEYTSDQIQEKLINALKTFYTRDMYLLEKNVNERSMTHKIAEYLQAEFLPPEKSGWNVDCEYNRNVNHPTQLKKLQCNLGDIQANDSNAKTVFPDIIVHKRDSEENLLVIEVKRAESKVTDEVDLEKLKAFTKRDSKKNKFKYQYKHGVFLRLGSKSLEVKVFSEGEFRADRSNEYCKALQLIGILIDTPEVGRSGV